MAGISACPVRRFSAFVRVTAATSLGSVITASWVSPAARARWLKARQPVPPFIAASRVIAAVLAPSTGFQATLQVRLPSTSDIHAAHMLRPTKFSRPPVSQVRAMRPVPICIVVSAVHACIVVLGQAAVIFRTWVVSRKVASVHARRWGQVFSTQVHAWVQITTIAIVRRAPVGVQRDSTVTASGVGVTSSVIIWLQVPSSVVVATTVIVTTAKVLRTLALVTP